MIAISLLLILFVAIASLSLYREGMRITAKGLILAFFVLFCFVFISLGLNVYIKNPIVLYIAFIIIFWIGFYIIIKVVERVKTSELILIELEKNFGLLNQIYNKKKHSSQYHMLINDYKEILQRYE